jgi:SAM-dependent methyltransferase
MAGHTLRDFILLYRTFGREPISVRIHVLTRFLTCPFGRILEAAARATGDRQPATLLEIGAGYAIYSRLAVERGAGRAFAVEPDLRKAFASCRHPSIPFVAGYDDAIRGCFDQVALIDVLYKIPIAEWDRLLRRIASRLVPGGILVLKEHDPRRRLKHGWNRLQEALNSRFLGITLGESFSYERPEEMSERLHRAGFATVDVVPIDRGYPHPHLLYIARRS